MSSSGRTETSVRDTFIVGVVVLDRGDDAVIKGASFPFLQYAMNLASRHLVEFMPHLIVGPSQNLLAVHPVFLEHSIVNILSVASSNVELASEAPSSKVIRSAEDSCTDTRWERVTVLVAVVVVVVVVRHVRHGRDSTGSFFVRVFTLSN
jgi:hypothetical protein